MIIILKLPLPLILASSSPRRSELLQKCNIEFKIVVSDQEERMSDLPAHELVKSLAEQKARNVADRIDYGAFVLGADTLVVCDGNVFGKPKDEAEAIEMISQLQGKTHFVHTGLCLIDTSVRNARYDANISNRNAHNDINTSNRNAHAQINSDSSNVRSHTDANTVTLVPAERDEILITTSGSDVQTQINAQSRNAHNDTNMSNGDMRYDINSSNRNARSGTNMYSSDAHTQINMTSFDARTHVETTAVTFAPMDRDEILKYISVGESLDKAGAYGIQGASSVFIEKIDGCYFNVMGLPLRALYVMLKRSIREKSSPLST